PLAALDGARDRAADGDDAAVDVGFHLCGLADDHRLFGDDLALDPSVDAERLFETQLADHFGALIHEAVQIFAATQTLDADHRYISWLRVQFHLGSSTPPTYQPFEQAIELRLVRKSDLDDTTARAPLDLDRRP